MATPDPNRYKILAVDDSPQAVRVIMNNLTPSYEIFFALNGVDALRVAEREQPDLILLDIYMDGADGFEVCRQLKKIPDITNNPIIFITGSSEEADHVRGLQLGAVDFITKPINSAVLKLRVKLHLQLKRTIEDYQKENEARKRTEKELQLRVKESDELIVELKSALNKVKHLSGLLPICSQCKKIRDDKGYWNQIELYIQNHSDAEFSHSLCRECAMQLYPDLDIFND